MSTRCKTKKQNNFGDKRFRGSPTPKPPQVSPYWNKKGERREKKSNDPILEEVAKLRIENNELRMRLTESQKSEEKERLLVSLRTRKEVKPKKTPHYIPGMYVGNRGAKNGRPLSLETLRKVTSICASGLQFSKFEILSVMNDEEKLDENTFYTNAKHVWWAAEFVWKDIVEKEVHDLVKKGQDICIGFDGSWMKRYGFND